MTGRTLVGLVSGYTMKLSIYQLTGKVVSTCSSYVVLCLKKDYHRDFSDQVFALHTTKL